MPSQLSEYDFLSEKEDESLRKEAENILSSYSQVFDLLAEALQNSTDAIDARHNEDPENSLAKIRLIFDTSTRSITIIDTGTGIPWVKLQHALTPNITYKRTADDENEFNAKRSRGEKGVGLSFLTFICNKIRIKTCNGEETIEVLVENANDWVHNRTEERPILRPTSKTSETTTYELGSDHYTLIEMVDVKTEDYCDSDIFDMSIHELVYTIRTKTAVGNTRSITRDKSPEPHISTNIEYVDSDGSRIPVEVPYTYQTPEEFLDEGSKLAYEDFIGLVKTDKLHLAKGKALVYRDVKKSQGGRDIYCYAFAMAREAFDALTKDLELNNGWAPRDWTGIYVATRDMPTGIRIDPPHVYGGGYWRRIFMLLQDDHMKFDIGRKNLRGQAKPMVQDVAKRVWDDIYQYLKKLTPDDAESVRRKKIGDRQKILHTSLEWPDLDFERVKFLKQPQREQMVVALFYELVGAGIIEGYHTIRSNTFDQYDAFVHYSIDKNRIGKLEAAETEDSHVDNYIIVEFKHNADSIIIDLKKNSKRYQDIDLLVCWEIDEEKFEKESISVKPIPKDSVYFYGSTHWLFFPGVYQAGEHLPVIELKGLITSLQQNDGG